MVLTLSKVARKKPAVTIALWVVISMGLFISTFFISPDWIGQAALPQSESNKAMELIDKELPDAQLEGSFRQGYIVFHSDKGIIHHREAIQKYIDKINSDSTNNVIKAYSPVDRNYASQISRDGRTAYATVFFRSDVDITGSGDKVMADSKEVREDLTVEFSGLVFDNLKAPHNEIYGIIAAIIILTLLLGSLVAAGLPIVTAIIGVAVGTSLVKIFSLFMGMPEVSFHIGMMMGIGVGIDYVLFILTRYIEAYKRDQDQQKAIDEAISTAGSAVFAAGFTVVISILGILVVNLDYLNGIAIGVSLCVAFMVLMALTLLPAILSTKLGSNLHKLRIPTRKKKESNEEGTIWVRWSQFVQRRSVLGAIVGVVILLIVASPILSLRIGVTDVGNESTSKTTKRAYDLLAKGFGPGFNGPLVIVVDRREATNPDALGDLMRDVEGQENVDAIYPDPDLINSLDAVGSFIDGLVKSRESGEKFDPSRTGTSSDAKRGVFAFVIYQKTAPQSEKTTDYVHLLRKEIIKKHNEKTGIKAYVTGITAGNIDFAETMTKRTPFFMGTVLLISFFLLLFTFRSVLVALKAIVMNIFSILAAYGVVIAVFQFGWLSDFLNVGTPGPIEAWAPIMLFAILFGLSMDYEVFLISKMKEEYDKSGNNTEAVTKGLVSTARVITAAALIMVCVFGSFAFALDRPVKLMGLGLAVAVFLDATVVRMLLVPATMQLLGDKNWWLPAWLDKLLPAKKTQVH